MRKKGCIEDWLICRISGNIKTFTNRITKKNNTRTICLLCGFYFCTRKTSGEDIAYDNVEKLPEIPGGINEFRTLIMKNFRTDKLKMARGVIKTTVNF